ncbi:universal stress protein [Paraburkholderia sp.]|uniref:universal stress protein n=1 Tax=Paraburkholderia sp. TaxID=1926495 RepID=UPI00261B251A|nr:universal stress protein [Paraburkholderia sp.]
MFKKILVAVSTSSADSVLAPAIEAARKYDAQIVALHVVDPSPSYIGGADCNFGLIVEAMEAHGHRVVAHVRSVLDAHALPAEVRMVTLPFSGMTVGSAIAAVAEETGADLILLGRRNTSRWHWLSEDVAAEMMRHTSRPAQIVTDKPVANPARRTGRRWIDVTAAGTW